jgi:nucleotide-binding universal stress UspA family protein
LKTVLALIGGGDRDAIIMQTAYAAAMPLGARLDFLHIHVSAGIAIGHDKHAHFAVGNGIKNALDSLNTRAVTFSEIAASHALEFREKLEARRFKDAILGENGVIACFREENDVSIDALIAEACNCDLIVMGRARQTQGLSQDTLERLVRQCGRPVLIVAGAAPQVLPGTVMVCWNNSKNVNRVLFATAPLLMNANRLVFVNIGNDQQSVGEAADKLRSRLEKMAPSPEVRIVPKANASIPAALAAAARDCTADLVVMGAYGRSWIRELIFGSRTDEALAVIDRPIIMMH